MYKAYQASTEHYVALKVFPHHFASERQVVALSARSLAAPAAQRPHILPVFDFGQVDGCTYIVMPFVQGA